MIEHGHKRSIQSPEHFVDLFNFKLLVKFCLLSLRHVLVKLIEINVFVLAANLLAELQVKLLYLDL